MIIKLEDMKTLTKINMARMKVREEMKRLRMKSFMRMKMKTTVTMRMR